MRRATNALKPPAAAGQLSRKAGEYVLTSDAPLQDRVIGNMGDAVGSLPVISSEVPTALVTTGNPASYEGFGRAIPPPDVASSAT
ncbi:Uu.00g071050.m01.CDS01 [Anthostomella pinea]|uniref:Uu.00g071050.m01.CDS01 n=1 Tax=Anthostomella pinea TaxID=933095 RepID=A0AAI8YNS1_9PEZI|nr:Uu.00g071050.m01.CDS01 [Anthostomella pinea]